MANVVGLAAAGREQHQRAVPPVETRRAGIQNTNEEEDVAKHGESCFKEAAAAPDGSRQADLSRQPQRDVAVLMADTPSPAPSVISIRSDLSDEEEGNPRGCPLNQ